jgi:maltose alpha-D-glucosyltransferase/alpha-amylase
MEAMFDMLGYELPQLPPGLQASGSALLSARPALYQRILRLADVRAEGMKTRYHGDFRLGQLWLTNNDLVIANAGGEPALPWAERRLRHTPLRDVAAMLFSLSEAGTAAVERAAQEQGTGTPAPGLTLDFQTQVDLWERLASRSLFGSYRRAMAGHPSCPAAAASAEGLVTLALAERAIASVTLELSAHALTTGAALRRLLQLAQRGR